MRRAVLMMLVLAGGAFADNVVPICAAGTLLNPITLAAYATCTVGPLTYKNFAFFGINNADGALIDVAPPALPNIGMSFTSSTLFKLQGGSPDALYGISYFIDPPPDIIDGFETSMDVSSPLNGGTAVIETSLCIGGYFSLFQGCINPDPNDPLGPAYSVQLPNLFYTSFTGGKDPDFLLSASLPIIPPRDMIHVLHLIRLHAPVGGSSEITGVRDATTVVPEPSAALLLGTVVAALAALRARRKRR